MVLIITSGFVVGTTATFTSSTRNGGNTFTVAGIGTASNATVALAGTTATIKWTDAVSSGQPYNSNVGYRILRAGINGTADGIPPACGTPSYSYTSPVPQYAVANHFPDPTDAIPSTAVDQGKWYCYGIEGVWPCCPSTGLQPIVTSLATRAQARVQTGFVVSKWLFDVGLTGISDNSPGLDEQVKITFNQPVLTSSSITATENVCIDPYNSKILLGVTATTADSCQNEVQTITITGSPTSGSWKATSTSVSANIAYNASAATVQTALQGLTGIGAGNAIVTGPVITGSGTTKKTVWKVYFAGTRSGNQTQITVATGSPGLNAGSIASATPFDGTTETTSIGNLTASGSYTGLPARWDIATAAWSTCAVAGKCTVLTITLGNNLGANAVTLPSTTWTMNPNPSPLASKTTSATGTLPLCVTDPAGAPTQGLCRPTAAAGW